MGKALGWVGYLTVLVVASAGVAVAQGGDGAGMAQGEASINVRSDVKLGIKGTAGTTSERLMKLGEAATEQMPEIRACYRKQVAKSPEVIGALRVLVSLEEKAVKVDVTTQEGASKDMTQCVAKVLEKANWKSVGRPATAVLSLEFDNTRARGQALMNERVAETARVEVRATPDGKQEANWSTEGNQVTFTVRAEAGAAREGIELAMRAFQAGYAGFLDCRRHCEKGGTSPEGDITAQLVVDRQGKSNVKIQGITINAERAPRCAERAFNKVDFEKPASVVRAEVVVHFAK
jgi:hypothetical protein